MGKAHLLAGGTAVKFAGLEVDLECLVDVLPDPVAKDVQFGQAVAVAPLAVLEGKIIHVSCSLVFDHGAKLIFKHRTHEAATQVMLEQARLTEVFLCLDVVPLIVGTVGTGRHSAKGIVAAIAGLLIVRKGSGNLLQAVRCIKIQLCPPPDPVLPEPDTSSFMTSLAGQGRRLSSKSDIFS